MAICLDLSWKSGTLTHTGIFVHISKLGVFQNNMSYELEIPVERHGDRLQGGMLNQHLAYQI